MLHTRHIPIKATGLYITYRTRSADQLHLHARVTHTIQCACEVNILLSPSVMVVYIFPFLVHEPVDPVTPNIAHRLVAGSVECSFLQYTSNYEKFIFSINSNTHIAHACTPFTYKPLRLQYNHVHKNRQHMFHGSLFHLSVAS